MGEILTKRNIHNKMLFSKCRNSGINKSYETTALINSGLCRKEKIIVNQIKWFITN
jgi:hypothetical protein